MGSDLLIFVPPTHSAVFGVAWKMLGKCWLNKRMKSEEGKHPVTSDRGCFESGEVDSLRRSCSE